jgi:anhydro-N-acetylmuramic acid kinase
MVEKLIAIKNKEMKLVIGLMSGTSADGVDVAVVRINGSGKDTKLNIIGWRTFPFRADIKDLILKNSHPKTAQLDEICRLNFLIAKIYVDSIFKTLEELKIDISEVDLIGTHGQTIQHLPKEVEFYGHRIRATLQIGEPSVIAKLTGIVTVGNFRYGDIALGGEGAPLVPYFDYIIFSSDEANRCLLNIGGIANFTVIKKGGDVEEIMAFDTGPGNMVINSLTRKFFNYEFDRDGKIAFEGRVSDKLLMKMAEHPYIFKQPPKSTGREEFGAEFVEWIMDEAGKLSLKPEDIIATASEFTAYAVYKNYELFVRPKIKADEVIVSGGGAYNKFILNSLRKYFNIPVRLSDEFGIPVDAKEAICFAVLANETIAGNPTNVKSVTGARERTILGSVYV